MVNHPSHWHPMRDSSEPMINCAVCHRIKPEKGSIEKKGHTICADCAEEYEAEIEADPKYN